VSRIVLSGYYGFNNSGDEMILYAIIAMFRKINPAIEITVLSNDPEKTAKAYNVKAVNRWSSGQVFRAISRCDLLISGGGSLLQDVSSKNSPLYYLGVIFLARLLGKPVQIFAQGIGPLTNKRNRRLAAWILNMANAVTVRETGSKTELAALGVIRPVEVTADPVLGLSGDNVDQEIGRVILERNGFNSAGEDKKLGVFVRSWGDNSFVKPLAQVLDDLAGQGWKIAFVPMQFPKDITVAKEITKLMDHEAVILREMLYPEDCLAVTKNFDIILGMRLHALINGAILGKPIVGISYDPKIDRFMEQIGLVSLFAAENLPAQTLLEMIELAYEQRIMRGAELLERVKPLFQKAWRTARISLELLEK
jgi:polysaccharide pyruvyl transferase CsaB